MRTHFSLVTQMAQWEGVGELTEDDVLPGQLPFFHIFGIGLTLAQSLAAGATSVLMPRFELAPFLRLVQDYGATRLYVVPPIVVALARQPVVADYDLSTVKTVVCGAAPLGEDVARACAERLDCRVKQIYGMSETGAPLCQPDNPAPSKIGTVGPCMPNSE